jgi:DNA-binding CsgD family transcriptional regulator
MPLSRDTLEAAEDFRQAEDAGDLWSRLRRRLGRFAVTNVQYGFGAIPSTASLDGITILDGFVPGYLEAKLREGLLEHDEFVRAGLAGSAPILWNDTSRAGDLTPEARRSLDIDWDLGVTTGVSIPLRFAGGLGGGLMGLHAAGMSWREFDGIWAEHGAALTVMANAFDTALRRDHVGDLIALSSEERDCLSWLAAGLRRKQIADRLRLTDRQLETRLNEARDKLKAVTVTQAVASALILGLIEP